jgi:hypothetical protein
VRKGAVGNVPVDKRSDCAAARPTAPTAARSAARRPPIVISSPKDVSDGGVTSATAYNHYSMLGTIQHLWGLDCLANTCALASSQLMTSLSQ